MPRKAKCPIYKECAANTDNKVAIWQAVFLFVAYVTLIKSPIDFNPSAVILFVVPQTIDLICCRTFNKKFKTLKIVFGCYSIGVIVLCYLILSGALRDIGDSYNFLESAVAFSSFKGIRKCWIAWSLLLVIAIPFISHMSRPEKNDDKIVDKYEKKGAFV